MWKLGLRPRNSQKRKEYINGIVLAVQLSEAHHNPNLPGGSMKFIWWKLKMSYRAACPSWDCPAVVCHLFLYLFMCSPTTAFTDCQKFGHHNSLVFFTYLGTSLLVQGFSFERGHTIFKIVKEYNLYRCVYIKVH